MTLRLLSILLLALVACRISLAKIGSLSPPSSSRNFVLAPHEESESCLSYEAQDHLKKKFIVDAQELSIRIETSNRVTHRIVSEILSIILKEVVGYEKVQIVKKEGTVFTSQDALQRLAECSDDIRNKNMSDSDCSMINLEVWLSPGLDIKNWFNNGSIEDCGLLGPIGRVGWYVPKSLVMKHWENGLIIDHWRAFQNETTASIFNLSKNGNLTSKTRIPKTNKHYCNDDNCHKGIYRPKKCTNANVSCATILADYPEHTRSSLIKDIKKLDLLVEVAWIGPELERTVLEHVARNEPVLFFNWKPNTLTHQGNFTNVAFPHCEDNSLIMTFGNVSPCEFEINQLEKMVWSQIKSDLPDVHHLVRHINFSQYEYLKLLDDYHNSNRGSKEPSIFRVACSWMETNEAKWHSWLPEDELMDRKYRLFIGGIFPQTGVWKQSIANAAKLAIDDIRKDESILKDYLLDIEEHDGACQPDMVMKAFIRYVTNESYRHFIGILGPACSETVEPIAGVAKHYNTIIISYSAEGALFNNREKYPYFFRTIPENNLFRFVYLQLLERLKWKRVASLTEDGQKYPEYISMLETLVREKKMEFVINLKFPRENYNMTRSLLHLKEKKARIIIGDLYDHAARAVMCEAFKLNMTAKYGYQWFLPQWFRKDWFKMEMYSKENTTCSTTEMKEALKGHMTLSYKYFADDDDEIMNSNKTVKDWKVKYKSLCQMQNEEESDYAGYAYDAVWVYAKALDVLLKNNATCRSTLHKDETTKRFVREIKKTNFNGVSGNVKFTGSSRLTEVLVYQWTTKGLHRIGTYHPTSENEGKLDLNESAIQWYTQDGRKPHDGSIDEDVSSCPLESLRKFLGVNCEVAIVSANLMGFIMFALLVAIGFLFFKRRYEEKFKRIKELGLMGTNMNKLALDEWEMQRDHIVVNRKLGEGAFGTVYGGEAFVDEKGWVAVAVKTLKVGADLEEKLDFLSEAEMMKRFDHSNIVRLLGVCTIGEPVYTVMEFMLYGDLKTYLLARRQLVKEKDGHLNDEISDRQLTNMALDIARGLSYLAEQKYVHRDLACRNCLVNANRTVKIGDFGMCRHTYDSDYYRFSKKGMLPVRWMAPESLIDGVFTPMSDVWSYAVLLYEVVTFGSFPYQGLSNNQVLDFVKNYNTLIVPKGCKPELEALFHRCWIRNPTLRPTASEILEILAHNQNLIAPCLDLPLASVQVEDTNSIELAIHERSRVHSISSTTNPIRRVVERQHSLPHVENGSIAVAALNLDSSPMTFRTQVIPAKGQYVTLQCKNSQDSDYGSSASRDLAAQGITAL